MAVITVAFYTSSLTSSLTVQKLHLPVNSLEELARSSLRVIVFKNGAMHGILASAKDGVLKRTYEKVAQSGGFITDFASQVDIILDNPKTVSLFDGDSFKYLAYLRPDMPNVKCNISIVSRINRIQHGFIFPKNSPYVQGISDRFVSDVPIFRLHAVINSNILKEFF